MAIVPKIVLSMSAQKRSESADMTPPMFRVLGGDVNNLQNDTDLINGQFLDVPANSKPENAIPTFCDKLNIYPIIHYVNGQMVVSLWTGSNAENWVCNAEGVNVDDLKANKTVLTTIPVKVIDPKTKKAEIVDFKITMSIKPINEELVDGKAMYQLMPQDVNDLTQFHNPPQGPTKGIPTVFGNN